MTILNDAFRKVFLSLEPIYYLDRNRYTRLLGDDFRELAEMDPSKLNYQGYRIDKTAIRRDVGHVFCDLKKTTEEYINEKNQKYGKD